MAAPTINISAFRNAPHSQPLPPAAVEVINEWRQCFVDGPASVAHILGHGVSTAVIDAACTAGHQFFSESSEAEKLQVAKSAERDGGNRGYRPYGIGSVSTTWSCADGSPFPETEVEAYHRSLNPRPPDLVEQYESLCDELDPAPTHQPEFLPALHAYYTAGVDLSKVLMALTSCALGLPRDYFESAFSEPSELNRLHVAFSRCGIHAQSPEAIRRGEHTDFESLTVLHHERGGLQVRIHASGEWVDVPPVAGALTITAGDLLQLWSNDRIRSCVHRVTNETSDRNGQKDARSRPTASSKLDGRLSLVLFTGPTPTTLIEPLPTCVSMDNPGRYAPIVATNHVSRKLQASGNLTPVVSAAPAAAGRPAQPHVLLRRRVFTQLRGLNTAPTALP